MLQLLIMSLCSLTQMQTTRLQVEFQKVTWIMWNPPAALWTHVSHLLTLAQECVNVCWCPLASIWELHWLRDCVLNHLILMDGLFQVDKSPYYTACWRQLLLAHTQHWVSKWFPLFSALDKGRMGLVWLLGTLACWGRGMTFIWRVFNLSSSVFLIALALADPLHEAISEHIHIYRPSSTTT